jgi:hypothetical protein
LKLFNSLKKRGNKSAEVLEKMLKNVKKYIEKGIGLTFYKHLTNDDLNKYYENIA